jgi:hypothetical protein
MGSKLLRQISLFLVFCSRGGAVLPNGIACQESIIGPAIEAIKPHPNSWTLDDHERIIPLDFLRFRKEICCRHDQSSVAACRTVMNTPFLLKHTDEQDAPKHRSSFDL